MKQNRWKPAEVLELRRLVATRKWTYSEIADQLGRAQESVKQKAGELGLKNPVYLRRKTKHRHLRVSAMEYFLTHSAVETQKRFRLTTSEFKSLMTSGYRDPALAHLRKDTRNHEPWTFQQTMSLLAASGLQQRAWIANRLGRGGMHSVKEMTSRLNMGTRYVNGLPKRLADELVGHSVIGFKTNAGPDGRWAGVDCRPVLVPWVVIYSEARKSRKVPPHIVAALRAMARFQRRIHGTRSLAATVASIRHIIEGKL